MFERKWVIGCARCTGCVRVGMAGIHASFREFLGLAYLQDVQFDAATAKAIASFSIRHVGWFVVLFALAAGWLALVLSGYFSWQTGDGRGRVAGNFCRRGSGTSGRALGQALQLEGAIRCDLRRILQSSCCAHRPYENRVWLIVPVWLPVDRARTPQQIFGQHNNYSTRYIGTEWLQHLFQYYNIQSLDIIQMPRPPSWTSRMFDSVVQLSPAAGRFGTLDDPAG